MNESKIVDMALLNNGIHVNVTKNNDTCVSPRGHAASSESRPSTSPADTNAQLTKEALAEDCTNGPLPHMPVTT